MFAPTNIILTHIRFAVNPLDYIPLTKKMNNFIFNDECRDWFLI